MNEVIIAVKIIANCADGSVYNDVTMKAVNNEIVFETPDGKHLCGDCCVKTMDNAEVFVGPIFFGTAIMQYRNQEN